MDSTDSDRGTEIPIGLPGNQTPQSSNQNDGTSGSPGGVTNGRLQISPGVTAKYVPECGPDVTPYIGQIFKTLGDGIQFYKQYAKAAGFNVRIGGHKKFPDNTIKYKFVLCNKQGHNAKPDVTGDSVEEKKNSNRKASIRVGCAAEIGFKFNGKNKYAVYKFEEAHSHVLVSEEFKRFQKGNRILQDVHRTFIMNCSKASIGATKSYRLFKEAVGSYSNIGCSKVEFKNFARDMKSYACGLDAQMIVDKYAKIKASCSGYFFDYHVNNENQLTRIFWADPIARRNFACFGDAMSFDATYSTNRYNMIFAPFIGKDSHGKLVTFGASLISREDVESYMWVFEKFKECMGHNPTMIITDQDPAMKIAIERVFVGVVHRLCMWHIMFKVSDKVPQYRHDENFKERLCDVVWCGLTEPTEFETKFHDLLVEFGLTEHKWLNRMFALRQHWIPAYFRDTSMSGLFRTTSMSESENSLFGTYMRNESNLVEFFMHFDSALDSQRNTHDSLNADDESTSPIFQTKMPIEKHAASIYTFYAFSMVQTEIEAACFICRDVDRTQTDELITYKMKSGDDCDFEAVHNKSDGTFQCSCKHFVSFGILCRHIFFILKDLGVDKIPEKYIVSRWTKMVHLHALHDVAGDYIRQCAQIAKNKQQVNNLVSSFYSCLTLVDADPDKINKLQSAIDELKSSFQTSESHLNVVKGKRKLADFYECEAPENPTVMPPAPVNTKGSRSSTRHKSQKELSMDKKNKALRKCGNCGEMATHDSRNCPAPKKPRVT